MQVHDHTLALTVCTYMRRLHTLTLIQIHTHTHAHIHVSVCLGEDTQTVRPSIYPFTCLCVCLSVLAVFLSLSVGLSACLPMSHSVYTSFFYLSFELLVCSCVCISFSLCSQRRHACFIIGHGQDRPCPCRLQIPQ